MTNLEERFLNVMDKALIFQNAMATCEVHKFKCDRKGEQWKATVYLHHVTGRHTMQIGTGATKEKAISEVRSYLHKNIELGVIKDYR